MEALLDNFGENDDLVIHEAIQFFFLGFHTLSIYMTWVFYFLSIHQDVQTKVLEEIRKVTADKDNADKDMVTELRLVVVYLAIF